MDQYQQRDIQSEYVSQLESRLRFLEDHHRGCTLNTSKPTLLQSPPASSNDPSEDSESEAESTSARPSRSTSLPNEPSIEFVHYERPAVQNAVRRPVRPRWMQEADILLEEVPEAAKWVDKWKKCGVSSACHNQNVICTMLGTPPTPDSRTDVTSSASSILDSHGRNAQETLITSVSKYAEVVRSSDAAARLFTHIAAFQELVFVSSCVILLDRGIDMRVVDDIMRICISNSTSKTLKRLRAGARWLDKVINELQRRGWGQRASEIFMLRKDS